VTDNSTSSGADSNEEMTVETTSVFRADFLNELDAPASSGTEGSVSGVEGLPTGSALLVVKRGPNAGSRFLLDQATTSAGRHPDSDIFLDDVTVRRRQPQRHLRQPRTRRLGGALQRRRGADRQVPVGLPDRAQERRRQLERLVTAPDTPAFAGMSIGAVLDLLRPDFPDVTISKIRFLEAEGLVTPERTPSGYRRFTAYDCARLRFVLTAQRDHYLPLKVIKAQLDEQPDGELPTVGSAYAAPRLVPVSDAPADGMGADAASVARTPVRLSREDLLARSGVDEALLGSLVKAGVIKPGAAGFFDEYAVVTAQCAKALAEYGVEPRHLRAFRSAADRQSDLIAQIAGPVDKAGREGARDRADDLAREVAALAITLHTSLIKSAVRDVLDR
jgi:DNA-binding transcriptional MerR regulator